MLFPTNPIFPTCGFLIICRFNLSVWFDRIDGTKVKFEKINEEKAAEAFEPRRKDSPRAKHKI